MLRKGSSTPWGPADCVRVIAEGIVVVSTPGHGGIWLDGSLRTLPFPFTTFAGGDWYEEDEDVLAPMVAFAAEWTDQDIALTVRQLRSLDHYHRGRWAGLWRWLTESAAGTAVLARADKWYADHAGDWYRYGCSTRGGAWRVYLRRVGDGVELARSVADYPDKSVYTNEEVEAMKLVETDKA